MDSRRFRLGSGRGFSCDRTVMWAPLAGRVPAHLVRSTIWRDSYWKKIEGGAARPLQVLPFFPLKEKPRNGSVRRLLELSDLRISCGFSAEAAAESSNEHRFTSSRLCT